MLRFETRKWVPTREVRRTLEGLAKLVWCVLLVGSIFSVPVMGQTDLQIISPANGTIVAPGQSVSVAVSAGGTSFTSVGIVLQDIGFGPAVATTKAPYVFSVTIPNNVIGPKTITAFGTTRSGTGQFSSPITIDVETTATITAVSVSPTMINFDSVGEQIPLTVTSPIPNTSRR